MKKIGLGITVALLLSACANEVGDGNESNTAGTSEEEAQANTIVESQLTEREEAILHGASNQSLIFDYTIDSSYDTADVWVEKYEFGEKTEMDIMHISMDISERDSGYIVFTPTELYGADNELLLTVGISTGPSSSYMTTSDLLPDLGTEPDEDGFSENTIWGTESNRTIDFTSGEVILGSLIAASMDEGLSTLSRGFYTDMEGNRDEIEDYETIYLIKAEFTGESQ